MRRLAVSFLASLSLFASTLSAVSAQTSSPSPSPSRAALASTSASPAPAAAAPASPAPAAGAPTTSPDYAVAGGWYYTQTGSASGKGFNLLDSGLDNQGQVISFYSEFKRLGGLSGLGYPASTTFTLPDGFTYEATQAALLQWNPSTNSAQLANVFDMLSKGGFDKDLSSRGIPAPITDDGSGGIYGKAVATRLSWLTNPLIKARYEANPSPDTITSWDAAKSPIQLYGLPTSMPQRSGPFIVQRFQRAAFQLWLDAVPGQPAPGTVVPILGGDLAKQFAVVPVAAQAPQPPVSDPGAPPVIQASPAVKPAVDLLIQFDQTHGTSYMRTLAEHRVGIAMGDVPQTFGQNIVAVFSPSANLIRVNPSASREQPTTLAVVLGHESQHASDRWNGIDIFSEAGCYKAEVAAFKHQSEIWRWLYPNLKNPPGSELEAFFNKVAIDIATDPIAFAQTVETQYKTHGLCGPG